MEQGTDDCRGGGDLRVGNNGRHQRDFRDRPLNGTGGDDTINGLAGDDTITAGTGNDILDGGEGNDIYKVGLSDGFDTYHDTGLTGTDSIRATVAPTTRRSRAPSLRLRALERH